MTQMFEDIEQRLAALEAVLDNVAAAPAPALNNLAATAAPGASDDSGDGYGIGSVWINVTLDVAYQCVDATAAAAVWRTISNFVPLVQKLTSTSWDGDAKTASDNGVLDLSAVFGLPADISAVLIRISVDFAAAGDFMRVGSNAGNQAALVARAAVGTVNVDALAPVPCDGGDIHVFFNQNTTAVFIQIWGYWL